MLQQLRQADDKSCKKRMDCKHDIYAMLFKVNFRMSWDAEKLLIKLMNRLMTQEWVLPKETAKRSRGW